MLLASDEMGRTQQGNNNAYCRTTRSPGSTGGSGRPSARPASRRSRPRQARSRNCSQLRPRARRFDVPGGPFRVPAPPLLSTGSLPRGAAPAGGHRVVHSGRQRNDRRRLGDGFRQVAHRVPERRRDKRTRRRGEPIRDDSFLLLLNAGELDLEFALPPHYGVLWTKVLDTAVPVIAAQDLTVVNLGDPITVPGRSLQVLRRDFEIVSIPRPANADAPGFDGRHQRQSSLPDTAAHAAPGRGSNRGIWRPPHLSRRRWPPAATRTGHRGTRPGPASTPSPAPRAQ